jgi:hypothetical protein
VKPILTAAFLILLLAEKPRVHSDFQFGTFPTSREAEKTLKDEKARLLAVAYSVGWSPDKLVKEFKDLKLTSTDLIRISDDMEDAGLLRRGDYDTRPGMIVIREKEFERMKESLSRHTQEVTKLLLDNWKEIENLADSLEGSKHLPRERVLYEVVASGILMGGLVDAFWEDGTMMLQPPRRGKTDRYYAWLVESNPQAAVTLKREIRESSGYRIVTIGKALSEERLNPDDLRGKASVYEEAEARRYRTFMSVFSRDRLLPYFKARRGDFLKLGAGVESGRYVQFREFFAWYYFAVADGVVRSLAQSKRIAEPETLYTYAIRAPQ